MASISVLRSDELGGMTSTPNAHPGGFEALKAQRQEIAQVLNKNWIGKKRSLLASINEFRYWTPQQVTELFEIHLPPIVQGDAEESRTLYPLGPLYLPVPTDSRRWKHLAQKAAMIGALDVAALAASPLLLFAGK
jgi:hypothetical protein